MLYIVTKWVGDRYETMEEKLVAAYDALEKAIDHLSIVHGQVKSSTQNNGVAELSINGERSTLSWSDGQWEHYYTIRTVKLQKEAIIEEL